MRSHQRPVSASPQALQLLRRIALLHEQGTAWVSTLQLYLNSTGRYYMKQATDEGLLEARREPTMTARNMKAYRLTDAGYQYLKERA